MIYINVISNTIMHSKSFETKRFGLTMPKKTYDQLEEKRGVVPRSVYIREVLKAWWDEGHDISDLMEVS